MNNRTLLLAAAFLASACQAGLARRARTDQEIKKKLASKDRGPNGTDFHCETMVLTGTHVPQTYCYYRNLEAEEQAHIQMQLNKDMQSGMHDCPTAGTGFGRSECAH